jgi:hypothetical protein
VKQETRIPGSCLCGSFRFEIAGAIQFLKNCYCSRCRKMSGASFSTYARAKTKDLRVLSGADAITTYERSPGNMIAFCNRCGSLVPHPPAGSALLEFGAGLLDADPGVSIAYHIYVGSRAPWVEVNDGRPQFEAMGSLPEIGDSHRPRNS